MKRPAALILALAIVPVSTPAPAQQPSAIQRRADVYGRTVIAVLTDAKGKPLGKAPAAADLTVLEDGAAVSNVALSPLLPPAPPAGAPAAAPSEEDDGDAPARRLHQTLFLDTTLLRKRSVKEIADGIRGSLDRLMANGPMEIVIADPEPRTLLGATPRAADVLAALAVLEKVDGKDLIGQHRRSFLELGDARGISMRRDQPAATAGAPGGEALTAASRGRTPESLERTGEFAVKSQVDQEIALIGESFRRLRAFATRSLAPAPRVLYLGSDGFDLDPNLFYSPRDGATRLQQGPRLTAMVTESTEELVREGWVVVPVGPAVSSGGVSSERSAETSGATQSSFFAAPEKADFLVRNPVDALRALAEPTGGDVVLDPKKIAAAVPSLTRTYVLTYTVDRLPDGKPHRLSVTSNRADLVVKTAASVAAGTLESGSAVRAVDALVGGPRGDLPVTVTIVGNEEREGGKRESLVQVRASLVAIKKLVARLGGGRMRVTLTVEVPGFPPVTHHEELALPETLPDGWTVKMPLLRPKDATRVSVVAEELGTGSWGAAVADLSAKTP